MSRVSPKQIAEWTENPVTLALLALVEKEIEDLDRGMQDAFIPFEPQKTQEIMAGLNGAKDTLERAVIVLKGDWDYFMEEENEPVRNNPEGE